MLRSMSIVLALSLAVGISASDAQTKKPASPGKPPSAQDKSISVNVYLRDGNKNAILLATRIWPDFPDYNAVALQRFFAMMKALEPAFKQDDEVAYTWANKERVAKCAIYLESAEAGAKTGTGTIVGCEANSVSSLAVTSTADPNHAVSSSQDPKHLSDVLDLFKKQFERARSNLGK